ncbi:MAG: ABC transporter substrate-binding protein [Elusimicrobiota bacterium]|nr:ABC transporter substrate-binding protein [Elusimicrobiota bacterium]
MYHLIIICFFSCLLTCSKKTEKQTTITWAVGKDVTGAQRELVEIFQKQNPLVKVNMMEMPESATTQHDVYVTYLAARDPSIDVYSIDIIWPAEFASAGWIIPVDEYIKESEKSEFLQGPINGCTYKNKLYAIPWFTDAGLLYYRKDLVSSPPKTWQELIQVAKILQEKHNIYGFVFQAQQYEGLVCNFFEYLWSNNVTSIDDIDSPEAIHALQLIVDIIVKHKIAPESVVTYKEEESREVFTSGNAVFLRNWPYVWALAQKSIVQNKVGIAPLPHFPGGKSSACLGGWNLAISKFSKNKDVALKFVKFMTSFEAQKIYAIKGGRLPTRKAVYIDKEVNKFAPYYKELYRCFISARPRPVSPNYSKISDILQIEIHKALTQKKTAKDSLKAAKEQIKKIL